MSIADTLRQTADQVDKLLEDNERLQKVARGNFDAHTATLVRQRKLEAAARDLLAELASDASWDDDPAVVRLRTVLKGDQ